MTNKIATQIVKQRLTDAKTAAALAEKTAYGGAAAMVSNPPNPTGKPLSNPAVPPPGMTNKPELWPTKPPDSVPLAFLYGAGQGLNNQLGAMYDLGVGLKNYVGGKIQSSMFEGFNPEYSDKLQELQQSGLRDAVNSFGRFVGLHKAWTPDGVYQGAQPANSAKDVINDIDRTYFSNPKDADLRPWFQGFMTASDEAAGAIFTALPGQGLAQGASKVPALAQIGNATPQAAKQVLTYGFGVPAQQNVKAIPFLAAQFGQAYARANNLPYSEYLPGPALDAATRETLGPWAPELIDGVLGQRSGVVLDFINDVNRPNELSLQEQKNLANAQAQQLDQLPSDSQQPAQVETPAAPQPDPLDAPQPGQTNPQPTVNDRAVNLGLPADAKPEDIELAEQAKINLSNNPQVTPETINNPDSPEALQIREAGQTTHATDTAAAYTQQNPPPTNPQDWGEWFKGMMTHISDSWNSMDPLSQLAVGFGVPIGIIGLLSGNLGGFMLGAIGLGVGGYAAAQSGMFSTGETANQTPPNENQPQNAAGAAPDNLPAPPKPQIESTLRALANSKNIVGDLQDKANAPVLAYIASMAQKSPQDLQQEFSALDPAVRDGLISNFNSVLQNYGPGGLWHGMTNADQREKLTQLQQVLSIVAPGAVKKSNTHIDRALMLKISRCWKGYEPVPGKKPYADGSCRPASGKKTQKKMKKKSADYLSFISADKPAILTLIRGHYGQPTRSQSVKVSAQRTTQTIAQRAS